MNPLGRTLETANVIVCIGTGGVGKTTTAASLAVEAARRGRRTVVVTIDPARRLADAIGLRDGLASEPQQVPVPDADATAGELWAMMLDAPAMLQRVVAEYAVDAHQAERIASNRFFQNMTTSLSGTQEYMASEALYQLSNDNRFDLVIVDTPPSRHALEFLESPGLLSRFLGHKIFKFLMLPTRTGLQVFGSASQLVLRQIGKIVGSDVLLDAVAFFQAFTGMEQGFQQRAQAVQELIDDAGTRFVVVAGSQRDTITETVWFAQQLAANGYSIDAVVVNRLAQRFGPGDADQADQLSLAAAQAGDDDAAAIWANLARLRHIAAQQRQALAPLRTHISDDRLNEVPLLPADVHDVEALRRIGHHLLATTDGES